MLAHPQQSTPDLNLQTWSGDGMELCCALRSQRERTPGVGGEERRGGLGAGKRGLNERQRPRTDTLLG